MTVNRDNFKKKAAAATLGGMLLVATPFIAKKEGVSLKPYQDMVGVWTICYGETVGVTKHSPNETLKSCSAMLNLKLTVIGHQVNNLVKTDMSESRWAALTSFTYNVGLNAFKNSSLLKRLNAGDPKACDALMSWTYISAKKGSYDDLLDGKRDGKKNCALSGLEKPCNGITQRRKDERELCYKL